MDTLSKEPEKNQEEVTLNEVNLNENEVVETTTENANEVIEAVVEITEHLNGDEQIAAEVAVEAPVELEINEEAVTEVVSEEKLETITEVVNEVIEPVVEITETPNEIAETIEPVAEVVAETIEVVDAATEIAESFEAIEEPAEKVENLIKEIEEIETKANNAIELTELPVDIVDLDLSEIHDELVDEIDVDYETLDKEQLVLKLEEAITTDDINSVKIKVASIKVAFIKIVKEERQALLEKFVADGGKKEEFSYEENNLELRFRAAFDVYKEKKSKFNDEQEKIKINNLAQKHAIIEELKVLINSDETLKQTYDEFKALQERWKNVGQIPRTEISDLWQNYHFLVEKFFDKVKINKELKDLDMRKNMESKLELCEKAEELLLDTSINGSFKKLQNYHDEWKSIGPVPQDKKDELWERFKTISDQINDRRRELYEKQKEEHEGNMLAKNALCEKAEQIATKEHKSLIEWQESTDEITDLMKIWKTIGPIGRKENEEIWLKLRTYLDTFFANKKEYYDKLKDEQVTNYNLKVELCLQAESIKLSNDWKKSTNDLLDLQKQWKEIGPVPRKISDKIWHRFRAACDEFFNNKKEFFKHINENEAGNLKLKEELIVKVKEFQFGENRNENLQALKDFQRQFTEIGFIPMQDKDRIYNEFRSTINALFEKLKINYAEASAHNFNQRVERMNPADASRFIGKERINLQNKISQMKEDIGLWENNIGFLAQSKNADLLKQEFEKKIKNAKQDLIVMEAKLKAMPNH